MSVAFTRLFLMRDLHKLKADHASVNMAVYVDDTSFDCSADSWDLVHERLLSITTDFAEIVARKNLKLTKGQIVASTLHRAKILAESLSIFGLTYTPSKSSRDIGVSCTAGST